MERALTAVRALTIPIIKAIGGIRRLLNFVDETAAANGVRKSAGDVHHVTGVHLIRSQLIEKNRTLRDNLAQIRLGERMLKAGIKRRMRKRLDHIPRLALRLAAGMMSVRIIRMHLNGKRPTRVDQLEEQGETKRHVRLLAGLHTLGSDKIRTLLQGKHIKRLTVERSAFDYAPSVTMPAYFPTFGSDGGRVLTSVKLTHHLSAPRSGRINVIKS